VFDEFSGRQQRCRIDREQAGPVERHGAFQGPGRRLPEVVQAKPAMDQVGDVAADG
jgi:hypothetical protein